MQMALLTKGATLKLDSTTIQWEKSPRAYQKLR